MPYHKAMANPIALAAQIVGGQAALARAIAVSAPTVNQWVSGRRRVPMDRCPKIESLTGGKVRCDELRPDIAWDVFRAGIEQKPAAETQGAV